jgi:glycosyltransferase involved in cell wall biosynthesis
VKRASLRFGGEQRIAILVHTLADGGVQRRMATLANGLAAAGYKVDFVSVSPRGAGALQITPKVRQIILTGRPWSKRSFRERHGGEELKAYLRRTRPTVLLAGSTNVHLIALLAKRALDEPPAVVLRAGRHPDRNIPRDRKFKRFKHSLRRLVDRWAYSQADLVIALSGEIAKVLRATMRHPERCVILPNPVVTDTLLGSFASPPPHLWLKGDVPVLLAVGRLVRQKDFATLLEAVAMVIRRRPVRLIILGEGKLREELEGQADELGISEYLLMPGQVSEVGAWMRHARLLVSSSRFEGLPGVIVEAFAAGCPVVATRCPGSSEELFANCEGGLLVPVGDAMKMADAIEQMLQKKVDRQKLSALAEPYEETASLSAHMDVLATLGLEAPRVADRNVTPQLARR